jgi:hypothetical protein
VIFSPAWSEAIIALWGKAIGVLSNPFTLAESNMLVVTINSLMDAGFMRAIAFAYSTDAGNQ